MNRAGRTIRFWQQAILPVVTGLLLLCPFGIYAQDGFTALDPSVELILEQSPADGGTIHPGTGTHRYCHNSDVWISASAKTGYRFAYWLGDVEDPESPRTRIRMMDSIHTIVAVFEPVGSALEDEWMVETGAGAGGPGAGALMPSGRDFRIMTWSPNLSGPVQSNESAVATTVMPVPEPATFCLLGLGVMTIFRRKRHACDL